MFKHDLDRTVVPQPDRRRFLATAVGSAALLQSKALLAARPDHVIVIGAGVIGASIAYHLAKRGVSVTVLEKDRPAAGATQNSFAWLNGYMKSPRSYYELNMAGLMGWRQLQLEIGPALKIQWGGAVYWAGTDDDAGRLRTEVLQKEHLGYPMRFVDPGEIATLLPGSAPGLVKAAAFTDVEGALDPVEATNVLLTAAQAMGARLVRSCEVMALEGRSGPIESLMTSQGRMTADHYVLAAGIDTMALARQANVSVPLVNAPGVLAHSKPLPPLLNRVIILPDARGIGIKQNADGRIVTGGHFPGTGDLKPTPEVGEQMLARAARYYPALQSASLDFMTLGHGVLPKDGLPVVGNYPGCPNLYVAAMNSGVTLAPIIGRLASIELIDGVSVEMLDPFRSSRFTAG